MKRYTAHRGKRARMVRSGRFKYGVHRRGLRREILFATEGDPVEMKDPARDKACSEALKQGRAMRRGHASNHRDRLGRV